MLVPDGARQEIKFVTNRRDTDVVYQWLRLHPLAFSEAYPMRTVHNVYFDTLEYSAYAENLAGVSDRTKVRYRWYGDSLLPSPGKLEIKQKRNQYGWKLLYKVKDLPVDDRTTWTEIRDMIALQLDHEGRLWLEQNPWAVMINHYRRFYYLSACGRIRVTLDFDQMVWDQRKNPRPNVRLKANLPETVVVECKFDRAQRKLATQVLNGLPIRVARHSKYMNAVSAII